MDRYQCHKVVEAGEIDHINGTFAVLTNGERVDITRLIANHQSQMFKSGGGYLVQYEDGYLSWSPKQVFEDGYRRIS